MFNATSTLNIVKTFDNLSDALDANAEIKGRHMYAGLADSEQMRSEKVNKRMGVTEYMMVESGDIFFVAHYEGQRILNRATSISMLSAGYISLGWIKDDKIELLLTEVCDKGDHKARKGWCDFDEDVVLVTASDFIKAAA